MRYVGIHLAFPPLVRSKFAALIVAVIILLILECAIDASFIK